MSRHHSTLYVSDPFQWWVCLVFVVFNLLLGIALWIAFYHERLNGSYFIVNHLMTYQVWGAAFFLLGLWQAWTLYFDSRRALLYSQIAGTFIKSIWVIALIAHSFVAPTTVPIALLMGMGGGIQFILSVFLRRPGVTR